MLRERKMDEDKNPTVSGRIDLDLLELLESHCFRSGITKSRVIKMALTEYLYEAEFMEEPSKAEKKRQITRKAVKIVRRAKRQTNSSTF